MNNKILNIIPIILILILIYAKGYSDGKYDEYKNSEEKIKKVEILKDKEFENLFQNIENKTQNKSQDKVCRDFLNMDVPSKCLYIHRNLSSE